MIAFMTIVYVVLVVLVFKVFRVPPRPWPIALMAALGVVMMGTIVVLWTLAAPISPKAVVVRHVVQLVPYVKGQVVSIPAQPNVPLKMGDILCQIDPTPYQLAVDQLNAQLQAAQSNVTQAEASIRVAAANIKRAQSDVVAAKTSAEVAETIQKESPQAISKLKLVEAQQGLAAAQAGLEVAQASEAQAQANLVTEKDNVNSVRSQLQSAEFNLTECTVRAPSDGFITDWQIREGTFVVAMPLAAAGTFIDTSDAYIVAPFPAQMLVDVQPGQPAELAFSSRPGYLFRGTVDTVIQASGEGQYTTSGKLPSAASIGSPGVLAVKIQLDKDEPVEELEMGSAGATAIYTNWGKPFHLISKVGIRMKKWMYFLPTLPSA